MLVVKDQKQLVELRERFGIWFKALDYHASKQKRVISMGTRFESVLFVCLLYEIGGIDLAREELEQDLKLFNLTEDEDSKASHCAIENDVELTEWIRQNFNWDRISSTVIELCLPREYGNDFEVYFRQFLIWIDPKSNKKTAREFFETNKSNDIRLIWDGNSRNAMAVIDTRMRQAELYGCEAQEREPDPSTPSHIDSDYFAQTRNVKNTSDCMSKIYPLLSIAAFLIALAGLVITYSDQGEYLLLSAGYDSASNAVVWSKLGEFNKAPDCANAASRLHEGSVQYYKTMQIPPPDTAFPYACIKQR